MIPRLRFDIGWRDLGYAAAACMRSGDPQALTAGLERAHGGEGRCVVALSVRSGFDALLQGLALPPGSEVLLSAITIPNMLDIVHAHGLRAVPLAVDPGSLGVAAGAIAAAITPHTRLIVVTHLLGGRMPMAAIADVAARHGIPLVEDAAQAFLGDGYRGAPGTLATMFSFGAIKTATALGGALLHIDDSDLAARMRQVLQSYPVLPRRWFLARLLRFAAASCLARRLPFTVFVGACRALGINDDRVLRKAVRGFRGRDLITEIRRAPPAPLLALLGRRLAQDVAARVRDRQARGERLARCLGDLARPGQEAGTAS